MTSLFVRRVIVWAVSMGLGVIISMLILTFFLPGVSPNPNAESVSLQTYGIQYFFWTAFPIGLIFVTILDYFMDTKILPD
ncbi:MAG: hypothetical protein OHK0046_27580 [Anaerolineae bacterium]